jgi:2-aminoethylphosphonate-pyruvate transaminase
MSRPTILLNPGPVTLSERVRATLHKEDQCHREPEFTRLVLSIKDSLGRVYQGIGDDYDSIILSGSGTCAVEAMVASLLPRDGKALVIANGVYGERMAAMVQAHGKKHLLVRSEWPEPMDLERVGRILSSDPDVTHVLAVHNETTTGRLNDIDALGEILRKHRVPLLLDAVSSFAGEEIRYEDWNLAALASTANKCIHGVPGICFVQARKDILEDGRSGAPSVYLDLYRYYESQKKGSSPFTQAVHVCFAFMEALLELEECGGWEARRDRYRYLSKSIREELAELGIPSFLDEQAYCSMISSFLLPDGVSYDELHDLLKDAGFVIYAGQGGLYHSIFRIANMGDIRDQDLARLVDVFRRRFQS